MVSALDKKMVGVLCIVLLFFAVALVNLMTQRTKTIREGDILTVRVERSIRGGGPGMFVKRGKLEPSWTSWTYHIQFEELAQDSIQTNITYYYDGLFREEESGKLAVELSQPTNLTFISIRINSIDSKKARITIQPRS